MNAADTSMNNPAVIDSAAGCNVYDSGWQPATPAGLNIQVQGKELHAQLKHWTKDEQNTIAAGAGEEMGAVISGKFQLRYGDELHTLNAGQGILIPQGREYTWKALENGVLYQVTRPEKSTTPT